MQRRKGTETRGVEIAMARIRIDGSANDETIYGSSFDDEIYGYGGRDLIYGNTGRDIIFGGDANDELYGHGDGDWISGDAGLDRVFGGDGNDTLLGQASTDTLFGEAGDDHLFGNDGNDTLYGGPGNDELAGDWGYDLDDVDGLVGHGDDALFGGDGNDIVDGGPRNDRLRGGQGVDALWGDRSDSVLDGADQFIFDDGETGTGQGNRDVIWDFVRADGDKIDVSLIDANITVAGDQAFTWAGGPFIPVRPGILSTTYNAANGYSIVYGNVDNDAAAEFEIQVWGGPLGQSDFLL